MPTLLLIGLPADERLGLDEVPLRRRMLGPEEVADAATIPDEPGHEVVAALVGVGDVPSPLSVVQRVHERWPSARVALVTEGEDPELRRKVRYAPGVPLELRQLDLTAPSTAGEVAELCGGAIGGLEYERVLTAVGQRAVDHAPRLLVRATLGTLLENAPLGVLVADVHGRVLAWNNAGEDLLDLDPDSVGSDALELLGSPAQLFGTFARAPEAARGEDPDGAVTVRVAGDTWLDVDAVHSRLDDGRDVVLLLLQDVTARHRAEQERDRLNAQMEMFAGVSEALLGTLDPEEALRGLAEQVVPTLGDWVALQVFDERLATSRAIIHHRDPDLQELAELAARWLPGALTEETPSRRIARGEGPLLVARITPGLLAEYVVDDRLRALLSDLGVQSLMAVPLPGRSSVLGSMVLVNGAGSPPFTRPDLRVAREVGRRAGGVLETMQLYSRQRALVEELQRSLLTEPPRPGHTQIAVRYQPAADEAQIGGDWYDSFLQEDGSTVVVIGDVVGHDFRAAAAMGQLRSLLRGIGYTSGAGPADVLASLDETMEGLEVDTTASAVVAQVSPPGASGQSREMCWSNAGHPPPVLVPVTGDPVVLSAEEADLVLGVIPDTERFDHPVELHPGDTVVLYTDGLIERRGRDLDEGLAELVAVLGELRDLPLEDLCDRLLERLLGRRHEDDVAVLAVRLRDPEPQPPAP